MTSLFRFMKTFRIADSLAFCEICIQYHFNWPACLAPTSDNPRRNSEKVTPIYLESCYPIKCQADIQASISALLCSRYPFAIFWLIALVVVNSLKREVWRAVTHISEKILEGIFPSSVNFYSSIMIAIGALSVGLTSHFHCDPPYVGSRFTQVVSSEPVLLNQLQETAATLIRSATQCATSAYEKGTALALTPPDRKISMIVTEKFCHSEPAEFLAENAFCSAMNIAEVCQC